jgi:hypothetical protein
MIVTSNGRDWVEQALDGYAQTLAASLPATAIRLRPPISTASEIQAALNRQAADAFFFFGHGYPPPAEGFAGNDGNAAIHSGNAHLLTGRTVAATCCHGDRVGELAQAHRFSMFGYVGRLALLQRPAQIEAMEEAALAGPRAIAAGRTAAEAAVSAQRAFSRLAQMWQKGGNIAFAAFMSMNASSARAWPGGGDFRR